MSDLISTAQQLFGRIPDSADKIEQHPDAARAIQASCQEIITTAGADQAQLSSAPTPSRFESLAGSRRSSWVTDITRVYNLIQNPQQFGTTRSKLDQALQQHFPALVTALSQAGLDLPAEVRSMSSVGSSAQSRRGSTTTDDMKDLDYGTQSGQPGSTDGSDMRDS